MTCPRCTGLVITQYGETRCLLCGYYPRPAEPLDVLLPNPARQWDSTLCSACHTRSAVRGKAQCMVCRGRDRGEEHGAKVKAGMRAAKGAG